MTRLISSNLHVWITIFLHLIVHGARFDSKFSESPQCTVRDCGAIGDGVTDDSQAFLECWERCQDMTVVPPGRYLVASVALSGEGKTLRLENGARLLASNQRARYGPTQADWYTIALEDCKNCSIVGDGDAVIDGRAQLWVQGRIPGDRKVVLNWKDSSCGYWKQCRPRLLGIRNSKHCSISNLRIVDSVFWTTHIINSTGVHLSHLTIRGDYNIPNNDGIDIDSSENVEVRNVDIRTADDGICIKTTQPGRLVRNILVSGGVVASRSAAIKFGSESHADFANITVENIQVMPSHRAIGVQLRDAGSMENVTLRNIQVAAQWCSSSRTWWGGAEAIIVSRMLRKLSNTNVGELRNLVFKNITGASEAGIVLVGGDSLPIGDITLSDVDVELIKRTSYPGGYRDLRPGPADIEEAALGALFARNIRTLKIERSRFTVKGGNLSRMDWGAAWQLDRGMGRVLQTDVDIVDERRWPL